MRNLKKITEEQKVICSSGKSIMYTCENKSCNKHIEEFMEV